MSWSPVRAFGDLPMRRKLTLVIMATSVTALFMACAGFVGYEWFTFRRVMVSDLTTLADVIGSSSTAALSFGDVAAASEELAALRSKPRITVGCFYDPRGRLFAQYSRDGGEAACPAAAGEDGYVFAAGRLLLRRPVVEQGSRVGTLLLSASLEEMNSRLRQYALIAAVVLASALAAAFLLSQLLQRGIARQLADLADTARLVSTEKNLSVRAASHTRDELGLLAETFNEMLDQIAERDAALRQSNEALEARVRERTERLKESEERFRKVFEEGPLGMAFVDPQLRIIGANAALCSLLCYSEEEMVGRSLSDCTHAEDVPAFRTAIEGLFDGEKATFEAPKRCVTKDGKLVWVNISASVLRDDGGRPLHGLLIVEDITERTRAAEELKRSSDELRRSNKELEEFAFVVSHDLQAPLRMVTSYTQLLAKRYVGKLDANADEIIGFAVDGAARMRELIQDLLDYSRVGRKEIERRSVAIEDVLRWVLSNLQPALEELQAQVTHDPLPVVVADETQMRQLLQNLLSNALKFHGGEAPRIHVGARRGRGAGGRWELSVSDNGIGVAPEFAERIFVVFQRLHTREEYPGTGIGLAICKKIVERHGGRIWVEGHGAGGATFRFTLPAAGQNEGRTGAAAPPPPSSLHQASR